MGDRNTRHRRHQKTTLTLRPAPEHGAEKVQSSSLSPSSHTNPPAPSHRHPPMPRARGLPALGHKPGSSGWRDSGRGLVVRARAAKEGDAGGDAHQRPGNSCAAAAAQS